MCARIPGNGKSVTDVATVLWVIIIGDACHLFHILEMKYPENTITSRNIKTKKSLKNVSL